MTDIERAESNLIHDTEETVTGDAERGRSYIRLEGSPRRRRRRGTRRMRVRRRSRRMLEEFERSLVSLIQPMLDDVNNIVVISPADSNGGAGGGGDGGDNHGFSWWDEFTWTYSMQNALQRIYDRWIPFFGENAQRLARRWVNSINADNRIDIERMLAQAFGIDMARVFDSREVADVLDTLVKEATSLIKSVPEELFNDIGKAVVSNMRGEVLPEGRSITQQIQFLTGHTEKRARLIARDQMSKIHTGITQVRQESLGIEKYVWRTAKDARVVGNPGGLYPKGNKVHNNHYIREGKVFSWAEPPEDGHPGFAINCRCYAEPIIDFNNLNLA